MFLVPDESGERLKDVLLVEEIKSILTDSWQNIPEGIADTAQFKTSFL